MGTFNANEFFLLMRTAVKEERGFPDPEAAGLAGSFRDFSKVGLVIPAYGEGE